MSGLLQDVRYALRQLRKSPGFAATAVLTLALAIGVSTAVFSVIDAVLIRPLPYDHPEKIFVLQPISPQGYTQPASYPEYLDWRRENHVFSALAGASDYGSVNFEGPSGPIALPRVATTDNFFDVFGVRPILGRTFAPGEDQPGKNDVVVLSYEVWQQHFGGEKSAIGQTIKLDGRPHTVIGVMPAGFRYPVGMLGVVYQPLHIPKDEEESRGNHWLPTVARLRPDVSRAQAEADMARVLEGIGRIYPDSRGRRMELQDVRSSVLGDTTSALKVLVMAVLALLAIGCVNVAGLLLARGVKREREVALRSAVGAARLRIVRQMLTETLLLAVLGTVSGVLLAYGLLIVVRMLLISALARGAEVRVDTPALLVALALAVLTSVGAGLMPSLRFSGVAPTLALKSGGSTGTSRAQHRLRAGFIVAQVALSMVLLVTSGLLLRALADLLGRDLGFDPSHLLTARISLSEETYRGRDMLADFYQPLIDRVRALPGVKDAGVIQVLPIQNWGWNSDIHIVGHPPAPPHQEQLAEVRILTPGYFNALGIALVRGRMLDERIDTPNSQLAVVVNEAFVKKFFAEGEDPIGKVIDGDDPKPVIVGVVRSIRQSIYESPLAEMDISFSQVPQKQRAMLGLSSMTLVVRTSGRPEAIIPGLRQVFHEIDPGLPFRQPETLREVVADILVFQRLENWLFGTFAALAVALALVGLYGLISHEVEVSTRDIGLRLALGSTQLRVLGGIYRRVSLVLLCGVAVGWLAALAMQRLIASIVMFHALKDAGVILGLALGLFAAGLVAVVIPARRAAKVDPMVALRYE